ncbi:MAG: 50S ribosomal protein L9 [Gemmatimonadota bacterium]|nr:50S ribosomal protein L9 [Gemmatimonadota bacterium]MDH3367159.1 50S ribosomal protein L9 [Gemmatimonadota bacterium]MDH3478627.1 50S ribosomal protein L9 [Gemmatimonadota bacterium]MDH3569175.1 50S ribosomal protein L9 [Gemmatimonadota bacterium]MDH5548458.1 50S ribosomal protein L9 [Gemmatimonadota bacterium]
MEVILRDTIANLGRVGEVVRVKDGYARNYLLPRGLAYPATDAYKRRIAGEAKRRIAELAEQRSGAEAVVDQLAAVELHFTAKAGEGDRLFGSITSADIAHQLHEKGFEIDKRSIEIPEPIKAIGVYQVPIRLHPEVRAEIRVWVVKEE